MTRQTTNVLICLLLAAGCGRSNLQRGQQNYEVVQEGSTSGVTSTINAPGEQTPPATTSLTDTAVDTTTNFTLPDNPAPLGNQTPNSIAGSLPSGAYPSTPPRRRPPTTTAPPPPMSSGDTTTPMTTSPEPAPPAASAAPPTSSTSAPPPADNKSKRDDKKDGEKTDTTTTPPASPPGR
jgi:hypothetical protein